jgi:hypothetical protein
MTPEEECAGDSEDADVSAYIGVSLPESGQT